MTTKELQEELVGLMKSWQKIEDSAIKQTSKIEEKSNHPIVKTMMEVIRQDSRMHARVQGFIADSLSKGTVTLRPEDLEDVWDLIEEHIELERKTVEYAEKSLAALKGKKMVVQEYLLQYLLTDEEKHNAILDQLETIKKGMYPYG
ncbi:MAG: hypothetical protein GF341_07985 [candidate division Zixibacteria bacterium]|nr:hypothetical protein [candidate division Zixibacteria bacterium]